ncbi:glycosyltransferase [Desulfoplanes sp.]
MNKNILLISYYFPPMQNGGTGRPWSLFKYLHGFNIDVTVITTDIGIKLSSDYEKKIFRFPFKCSSCLRDMEWEKKINSSLPSILNNKKFDLVYSTFPLASSLPIGSYIKKILKIPFIIEFRDGLTVESLLPSYNKIKKEVNRLEKCCIKSSDRIITVSKVWSKMYSNKYNRHIDTIYNGFDPDDFCKIKSTKKKNNQHDMVLFGSILSSRSTDSRIKSYFDFLYALKYLHEEGFFQKNRFNLSFIGPSLDEERSLVQKFQLGDILHFYNAVPKSEGLAHVKANYDSLLLYGSSGDTGMVTSKLPEYLNLDMPIFGICEGNHAADIIRDSQTGLTCGFEPESIVIGLKNFIEGRYNYSPKQNIIKKFNRIFQASEIAKIIHETC